MARDLFLPPRLLERGVKVAVATATPEEWEAKIQADPKLPKNFSELRHLAESSPALIGRRAHFDTAELPPFVERCGEGRLSRILRSLENPGLSDVERESIDASLANMIPADWRTQETAHFILHWTDSDPNPAHNLQDPALIDEAGTHLEHAWNVFTTTFERAPFGSEGTNKIDVHFQDLGGIEGEADPPEAPIRLNAVMWQANAGLRATLATHELFHKLQYSFGYQVTWPPVGANEFWLTEGTARWAEIFTLQRLTSENWLLEWMRTPNVGLLETGPFSLPFWIFLDAQFRTPSRNALLNLLASCETRRDAIEGLAGVLSHPNPDLNSFFSQFAAEILTGDWRRMPSGQVLYPHISGPGGLPLEPRPVPATATLDMGGFFSFPSIDLGSFASCYHAITFAPGANGRPFRLEAREALASGDLSYRVLSLRAGQEVAASSAVSSNFVHLETVRLADFDTVVLIASSRGAPAQVVVEAGVN